MQGQQGCFTAEARHVWESYRHPDFLGTAGLSVAWGFLVQEY